MCAMNVGLLQPVIIVECNRDVTRNLLHSAGNLYRGEVCHKGFAWTTDTCVNNSLILQPNGGEKPFKCDLCQKAFPRSCNLKVHMKTHTEEKPHKCHICDKVFSLSRYLTYHLKIHTGDKQFKCALCGKAFATNTKLLSHTRVHTGDKPFKCELCGKAVKRPDELRMHMRIHTGEKPYKCQLCCNSFTSSSHLNSHMKTHTRQKPFKCELCHKTFAWKGALRKHSEGHNRENPCKRKLYDKGLEKTDTLNDGTYSGGKPSKFQLCNKAFETVDHLCTHARSTTDEKQNLDVFRNQTSSPSDTEPFQVKPFGCVICNAMFQMGKEFLEHCLYTCYSPVDNDFTEMFED